jgi:hypothetical protein
MESWKNIIPWRLVLPFIVIILIEYGLSQWLIFYNQSLNQEIGRLESAIKEKESVLEGGIESNEAFRIFSQAVNIAEIVKNRKSLTFIINKFNNRILPKFLTINNFSYDDENQEVKITASVNNWLDYLRFHKYVAKYASEVQEIEIKEIEAPKFDEEKKIINFSMVFSLKPNFYQQ